MPAVFAALVSAIMAGIASEADYHEDLYDIYPGRAISNGTSELAGPYPRGAGWQAGYQLIGLGTTIVVAIISGSITGE